MLKSVRVPEPMQPLFEKAETYVEKLFGTMERRPDQGAIRIGDDRYVLVRCESLYASWFDALNETFGTETARAFIYNTAREIGRSDARIFSERLGVSDPIERLSSGPVHFAHAGWALVDIHGDSQPSPDDNYFMHYDHPNTFESEVLTKQKRRIPNCGCLFSAGYSAGWCSDAFQVEVHGREIQCVSRGDARCEFIMAPAHRLDEHETRLRG